MVCISDWIIVLILICGFRSFDLDFVGLCLLYFIRFGVVVLFAC